MNERILTAPTEATYTFRYQDGQSAPHKALGAKDDNDFFTRILPAWEAQSGKKHIPGSVVCHISQWRPVPEPVHEEPASAFQPLPAEGPVTQAEYDQLAHLHFTAPDFR